MDPDLRINGGSRVPVALSFQVRHRSAPHREPLPRTCPQRFRRECAPLELSRATQGELDATLADWLNEIEWVQWMLRLTPRLRQKYQD